MSLGQSPPVAPVETLVDISPFRGIIVAGAEMPARQLNTWQCSYPERWRDRPCETSATART